MKIIISYLVHINARLIRVCNGASAVSLRKEVLKSGRHLYWKGKYSAVINLNILIWISRSRVIKIRCIDNMRQCQQLCRLSLEITYVIKINMFRDVSVFGSEFRICQAAVSSSIHLTLIFHSCLFIDYSLNPFLLYIIIVVQILVVYVKCNEKLSPDRRYRVSSRNFHCRHSSLYWQDTK